MHTITRWKDAPDGALTRSANGYWSTYHGGVFSAVKPIGAPVGVFYVDTTGSTHCSAIEGDRFARQRHPGAWRLPATVVGVKPAWSADDLVAAEREWLLAQASEWLRCMQANQRFIDNAATVWRYEDAPAKLRVLSKHNGDGCQWVVLWPVGSYGTLEGMWVPWHNYMCGSSSDDAEEYVLPCGAHVVIGSH